MKYAFVSTGIIAFGLIGLTLLFLFGALTVNNEQDYYNLKEVTEAAMIESIDIAYYRDTGELKLSQEKFVENFTRRFASSTAAGVSDYDLFFEDIVERPPKVSVLIVTSTGEYTVYGDTESFDIANKIDAILAYSPNEESNSLGTSDTSNKKWVKKEMKVTFYSIPYFSEVEANKLQQTKEQSLSIKQFIPNELDECIHSDIRNVKYKEVVNPRRISTQAEMDHYIYKSRETYEYNWEGLENTASSNISYIRYQAAKINITPSDFEYKQNPENTVITSDENDVYTCDSKKEIIPTITWQADYMCGYNNILAYNKTKNGTEEHNMCTVGIIFDVIFTYEQYE